MRRMVLDEGKPMREVARLLNVSHSTVAAQVRFRVPPSERPPARRAPPPSVAPRRKRAVRLSQLVGKREGSRGISGRAKPVQFTFNVYPSALAIARQLRREGFKHASATTVRRDLASSDIVSLVMPKGPAQHEQDRPKRVTACRAWLRCPQVDVRTRTVRILFSDEKICNTNWHGCRRQWVVKGKLPRTRHFERFSCSMMVWIVVGVGFKHMAILPKGVNINAPVYRTKCLNPILKRLQDWCTAGGVFQQDNAKPHQGCERWMEKKRIRSILPRWEPRSPDLSPVEEIHVIVEKRVWARPSPPATEDELRQAWREEFDALEQSVIDDTVRRFIDKCRECVRVEGAVVTV